MEKAGKHLVCVDGSDSSRIALIFACKKAIRRGGTVGILHVVPPADVQNLFGVADKVREERRQEADVLVRTLQQAAFQATGITPTALVREGRIGEEIINATLEDSEVSMLVLGASGRSGERKSLLSWLAEQLGDRLLVPLMLVPANLTDLQMEELS